MYTFDEYLISDLHKDAYGYRPTESFWSAFAAFNPDQKQALWDSLIADLNMAIEDEEKYQQIAIEEFEVRIDSLMADAPSRKSVVAWFMRQADCDGDTDRLEYLNSLPYGYLKSKGYV
jgi:hypothetical protein